MSQSNLEVVRTWMESFTEDAEAFRGTLHPELEWFPFEENHSPSHGVEGGMRIRNQWLDAWDEMEADVEGIVEEGDSVVASVHIRGRGKASGARVDVHLHFHFRVRDGQIVHLYEHVDKAEALSAMKRSEQSAHADADPGA
jgi:ketosteroid isomerase-like protein